MTAGDVDITNSIESEMLTSFLDSAGIFDGLKTSTPLLECTRQVLMIMDSKVKSIESLTDSGSVTHPIFPLLTCSNLSLVAPQHEDLLKDRAWSTYSF